MAANRRFPRQFRSGLLYGLLGLAAVWAAAALQPEPVGAYVLEGPHVLSLVAEQLSGVKALRVVQQVTVEDPAVSPEPLLLDETLSFLFPGNFRSDTKFQNTQRIHVVSHGQKLTIVDAKIALNPESPNDQYADLLMYHATLPLQKTLYMHGVDAGITSLGRMGNRIVFVVGANYPDESVSQVWVDKDQFVPLRWLDVRAGKGPYHPDDRWEFLYSQWQKVDGANYPFQIEIFHNQQRIRLIRVTKVDANAVIDGDFFNIARLQSVYPKQADSAPKEDRTSSQVDEVQRTIEEFKKKFEP